MESALQCKVHQGVLEENMATTAAEYARADRINSNFRQTILIVEDEAVVCEVTCEVLEQLGYRVLRAPTGAEARKLFALHADDIDLLLCDAILPDENGTSLCQALAHQRPRLKVILTSGYPLRELSALVEQPKPEFLAKPYSTAALASKVRLLLPTRRHGVTRRASLTQ
jgi:two-component system cell cycle sensor histidine kinase/response regulator CckA